MIRVQLRPGRASDSSRCNCYRIAGEDVASDLPLFYQNVFEKKCPEMPFEGDLWLPSFRNGEDTRLYSGQGWIGNQWRMVVCYAAVWGYNIFISGIGVFAVSKDGHAIQIIEQAAGADDDLIVEATLGPALILALAQQEKFCLHASAVTHKGRQIAFLGESGKGKSTLARWLDEQSGGRWRRIADDILPVTATKQGVVCLPHFPQPKVSAAKQPALGLLERLAVDAIYVIRRPVADERVGTKPLSGKDAMFALIRHTVSSRLFDAELLARHLDFCKRAGVEIPIYEVFYPLVRDAMLGVEKALANDIDALAEEKSKQS